MARLCSPWCEALVLASLSGCASEAREAARVALTLQVDGSGVEEVTTDLGYRVRLSEARVAVQDFQLTVRGEQHAAHRQLRRLLFPRVNAHPGHYQGGEITGELGGRFILDFFAPGDELGTATLFVGQYHSANFTLIRAQVGDGLADTDLLVGHTAMLSGVADRDGQSVTFRALIDSPVGRQLVGAPFAVRVTESSTFPIAVRLVTVDPVEQDTLFDGLDFFALPADESGKVQLSEAADGEGLVDAYNTLRRTLQTHDHFQLVAGPA